MPTIEAARAGESGKGFAVVANEVKDLSREITISAKDITQRVEVIQTSTNNAVKSDYAHFNDYQTNP